MKSIALIFIILGINLQAHAQSLEVITIGPGDAYWSAFGHTALKVSNASGQTDMYGFGYFDVSEEDFFIQFLMGEMNYFLGVEDAGRELNFAAYQERKIESQLVDIDRVKVLQLQKELDDLLLPENRQYPYNYFTNNCTSKVRDIINEVSGNVLKKQFSVPSNQSYYDVSFPAVGQGWINLGLAIGFGVPAYQERTEWEIMALPDQLKSRLSNVQFGSMRIADPSIIYQPDVKQLNRYSFVATHYPIVALPLVLLLLMLIKKTRRWVINFWLIAQSSIGLVLLFLWLQTAHDMSYWNFNVLLLFPLAFLLCFRRKATSGYRRPIISAYWLLLLVALWFACAVILSAYYLLPLAIVQLVLIFFLLPRGHQSARLK